MALFDRFRSVSQMVEPRTAIIDIGSNSIRLVVYQGPERLPAILFNEKVLAGLGRGLAENGRIAGSAMKTARIALTRFAGVAREMQVTELRTVATAAVRDAANGGELIAIAREIGLSVETLSGEQEATAAGYGVLSAIPEADGIVGDLGGGSLELIRVKGGEVLARVSLPLGVLRLAPLRAKGPAPFARAVGKAIEDAGWEGAGRGLPLYLVGGSWRSLARLDMHLTGYPLPVIHGYCMHAEAVARLARTIAQSDKQRLRSVPGMSGGRVATLGEAAAVLGALLAALGGERTIVSAYGLREGLLYGRLSPDERRADPLIVATQEEGRLLGRFPEHGELLEAWISSLFASDSPELVRLRRAACHLADVGWRANPEFRAERGVEVALHGNWVGIDATGRALVAQALHTCLGGQTGSPDPLHRLAEAGDLRRASAWGLAMRLGQRLSGGVAGPLQRSMLSEDGETLTLHLPANDADLYGETVARRHGALAQFIGRTAVMTA